MRVCIAAKSAENAFFARVIASQRKWAQRVVAWAEDTIVSNDLAYAHYFAKKA
jgi:TRAP-type mannitol/chloroaromatic compound transport system substrate-binding protein